VALAFLGTLLALRATASRPYDYMSPDEYKDQHCATLPTCDTKKRKRPMNILVTGATGFIASQIVTDLLIAGHHVVCCVRNTAYASRLFPTATVISCHFIKDTDQTVWVERLQAHSIDLVINCVGILYHPNKKITWAIHYDTPRALFDACVRTGVKKIIQISALGIDQSDTPYATSKKAAEDYLLTLPLTTVILRPSLVYGRGSYGGTSLFRGMAGLPWITPVPGSGTQEFQPICLQDLSRAVKTLAENTQQKSGILSAVGPERINLKTVLKTTRTWLGFPKTIMMSIPVFFIRIGALLGNLIPYSALNTTAYKMLMQNNITTTDNTKNFHEAIGFVPRNFIAGVYSQPSTVQDHWHARLYFIKPLLQVGIAFIWLFTALCSGFLYPKFASYALLAQMGISTFWQPILLYGASILDALIGFAILVNWSTKKIVLLQIIIVIVYTLLISWKLPYSWLDPFAPLAKNIPLLIAMLTYLALESDR
jgi:nucleoside-diphosphate-sugar epimerase